MEDEERLIGCILADVQAQEMVDGRVEGLIDFGVKAGLRFKSAVADRIWKAIIALQSKGQHVGLPMIRDTVNADGGEKILLATLNEWAGSGTSQGRYLIERAVKRHLADQIKEAPDDWSPDRLIGRLERLRVPKPCIVSLEDGKTLLSETIPPLEWLVDGIIPKQGLMLLAGRPKIGKSWLSLQLARSVVSGEPFLNRDTRQGIVLYFGLEDGRRRLQGRIKDQKWSTDVAGLCFFAYDLPGKLTKDGLLTIEEMIGQTEPVLIVLDALPKVLPPGCKENSAEDMADVLYPVSDLINKVGCAMLIVQHHRKGAKGEGGTGEDIRGSSAISGAVDSMLSLYREGRSPEARLKVDGRDMESVEMALGWADPPGWAYIGGAEVLGQREKKRAVIEALRNAGEGTAKEIAQELRRSERRVRDTLDEIVKDGQATTKERETGGRKAIVYIWKE